MNVEGHCYPVSEVFLDRICNLIGWRGTTTEDQAVLGTDSELVTALLIYLVRSQPEVRLQSLGFTSLSHSLSQGAVLVFLPGWDDIMSVSDLLTHRLRNEVGKG